MRKVKILRKEDAAGDGSQGWILKRLAEAFSRAISGSISPP